MNSSMHIHQASSSKSHGGQKRTASTSMDEGPSSKLHCGQERTGLRKWNPEHKIFLSHSGEQKEFVRQLYKDLKAQTLEPFFDETSLPVGERFAPFIFEAARQCLWAVILLSKDFLTSKWPMLELVEFVRAKKSHNPNLKLLPLFYKLSPEDLKSESIDIRWKVAWAAFDKGMSLDDNRRRLNLELCTEALSELCGANGLDFKKYVSEVTYREAIVQKISSDLLPVLLPDTSHVIGHQRLCKNLDEMFVKDTSEDINLCGTLKLGLYGMGGLGKTTMSKSLLKFYHKSFNGRVFHVELGSKSPLELQKLVLTELLRVNKDVVKRIHDPSQGKKLLKDHMKHQPVFLAIDNITSDRESKLQVLAFLEAGFHPGSRIMITSRSSDVVEDFFPSHPNAIYCKPMSKLIKEEAKLIFLQGVKRDLASLTIEEQEILDKCISQCHFVHDREGSQYHPLALHALANYNLEKDKLNMLKWKEHFGDLDKFRHSNASSNIFGVLELQFSTLKPKGKLIFLDLCLYIVRNPFCKQDSAKQLKFLFDIHDNDEEAVNEQLRSLKRAGIISISYNKKGARVITMHDLYLDFAKWFVMDEQEKGEAECSGLGCVYYTSTGFPYFLKKTCPLSMQLQRIHLQNLSCKLFPSMKVQEWCNVVVLHISKCSNLKVLDLHGLRCLCHLELLELPMLESFHFANLQVDINDKFNGMLESLQHVLLANLTSLKQLPDFGLCTSLKTFKMLGCAEFLSRPPSFVGCSQLEYLQLDWNREWRMGEFNVNSLTLTKLRVYNSGGLGASSSDIIRANNFVNDRTITGLGNCSRLQELVLQGLPIGSLRGLEKLTELQVLYLCNCDFLWWIPGVFALAKLKNLTIIGGLCQQVPGVERLQQLECLFFYNCPRLTLVPDLDHLVELKDVVFMNCKSLKVLPRLPPGCELTSRCFD